MNARIRAHSEEVERRLAKSGGDRENLARLAEYHHRQTQNFQHERMIHLLVTFFFGFLLLAALAGLTAYLVANPDPDAWTLGGLILLAALLLGTEVAYVVHYYGLENNVQKLYGLTAELLEAADAAEAAEAE